MAIENQSVVTCCDGKSYTKRQIMYRVFIWIIIILLLGLQISVERIAVDGMIHGELVDIHVFLCTVGGVWLLGTIPAMSPKNIKQNNIGGHAGLGFLAAILITAGVAVLHGNAKHVYLFHSVAGFVCLIAVWIQFILGLVVLGTNSNEENGPRWPMVAHTILGLTILISVALCFISGYKTSWFLVLYSFLSDRQTVFTSFSVYTALLTLFILSIPLYKITRKVLKYFRGST